MDQLRGEKQKETRAPYHKPVLRSISLAVDQVLGDTCKGIDNNPTTNLGGKQYGCVTGLCKVHSGS